MSKKSRKKRKQINNNIKNNIVQKTNIEYQKEEKRDLIQTKENIVEDTKKEQTVEKDKTRNENNLFKYKYLKYIISILSLFFIYVIIASNYVAFSDTNKYEYVDSQTAINYNIEYKTLPLRLSDVRYYLDGEELATSNNIFIPDGIHTLEIKCGLLTKEKTLYTYNGFLKTQLTDEEKASISDEEKKLFADFDNDGFFNYTEINLNLNITSKDDFKKKNTYKIQEENYILNLAGYGNFTNVSVTKIEDFDTKLNIVNPINIISECTFEKSDNYIDHAQLAFDIGKTDKEVIIYYYNKEKNIYEEMPSVLKENTISTAIDKIGVYGVVYKEDLEKLNKITQVAFVIDNSASLFAKEDYEIITESIYTGDINKLNKDSEQKRIQITKELISKMPNKYDVSITYFNNESQTIYGMSDDLLNTESILKNLVYSYTKFGPSIVSTGIDNGISTFTNDADKKYLVLYLDGSNISKDDLQQKKIIDRINKENIQLIIISTENCNENYIKNLKEQTNAIEYKLNDENVIKDITNIIINNTVTKTQLKIKDELVTVNNIAKTDFTYENSLKLNNFYTKNNNDIENNCLGIVMVEKYNFMNNDIVKDYNINAIQTPLQIYNIQNYLSNIKITNTSFELNKDYIDLLNQNNITIKNNNEVKYKNLQLKEFPELDINLLLLDMNNMDSFELTNEEKELVKNINKLQLETEIINLDLEKNKKLKEKLLQINKELGFGDLEYIKYKLNNNEPVILTIYGDVNKNNILVYELYQDEINPTKYYIEFIDPLSNDSSKIAILNQVYINNKEQLNISYQNYSHISTNKVLKINEKLMY